MKIAWKTKYKNRYRQRLLHCRMPSKHEEQNNLIYHFSFENHCRKLDFPPSRSLKLIRGLLLRAILHSATSRRCVEIFMKFTCPILLDHMKMLLGKIFHMKNAFPLASFALTRPLALSRIEKIRKTPLVRSELELCWLRRKERKKAIFALRSQFVVIISWQCCVSIAVPQKFFTLWACRKAKKKRKQSGQEVG